ncbi:MAG: SDR family oxidoreductase, partial [Deltaproteobacteria bacterium]|nr:SDR family oxidoreductase [Deltaproteobacteria bacterium]
MEAIKRGERVKGKVALVAGAGSIEPGWGNGKAAAVLYAREGAQVFAVDFRLEAAEETRTIIESEGGTCATFAADVTSETDVKAMVDACLNT